MRTAAILPVKRFGRAKARLAPGLPDRLRGELARAMVSDVLVALADCESLEHTIVVSGERSLPREALGGASVLEDEDELGQSAAVAAGRIGGPMTTRTCFNLKSRPFASGSAANVPQ